MSIEMNGGSAKVDLSAALPFVNLNEGSIALWALEANDSTLQEIFDLRLSAGEVEITNGHGQFGINLRAAYPGGTIPSGADLNTTDGWTHLALTWSKAADQAKLFRSGAQVGSTLTALGTLSGTLNTFALGNDPFNEGWIGKLSQFGLWSAALSPTEIQLLSLGTQPKYIRRSDLRIDLPLNQPIPYNRAEVPLIFPVTGGTLAPQHPKFRASEEQLAVLI